MLPVFLFVWAVGNGCSKSSDTNGEDKKQTAEQAQSRKAKKDDN